MKKLLLFAPLMLLAGCAGYKSRPLKTLHPEPLKTHKDIHFAAKAYDRMDSETYLGRDTIKAGYRPIQIAIKNKSYRTLNFSLNTINMPIVPVDVVARSVYQSVEARALGYGIPALFVFTIPLLIPAVTDSIWAYQANEQLLSDYTDKSIFTSILKPDSFTQGLIFVANSNYENQLSFTLIDRDTQEKIVCKTDL